MQQLIQKKQEPKYMPKNKKETRGGKRPFSGRKKANYQTKTIDKGIIAFQLVKFEINYFGSIIETITDTWIMSDGRQIVSGGCGFIKDGYEIK